MKLFALLTVLWLLGSYVVHAQPAGYTYGKFVAVNGTEVSGTTNLIDFPVLLHTTDPDLRSVANGGHVENSNGYDIIFTMDDCSTPLDHQIEKYNPVTGEYIAWIRIPILLATGNTNFSMYYGNSSVSTDPSSFSTWVGYYGVYHMDDDPSASLIFDDSGPGTDCNDHGTMDASSLISGKIGDALEFDGVDDYLAMEAMNFNNAFQIDSIVVSAWVKTNFSHVDFFENWAILDFDRSEYFTVFISGDGTLGFSTSTFPGTVFLDAFGGAPGALNDDVWHHIAAVYDGTDKLLYVDGALVTTDPNPYGGSGFGVGSIRYGIIGDGSEAGVYNGARNDYYFEGEIDELRFGSKVRNADWFATEYQNHNSPGTFLIISAEADLAAGDLCTILPLQLNYFTAAMENGRTHLSWETFSESDNDFYTIEKFSDENQTWEQLAYVSSYGNSNKTQFYEYWDEQPHWGANYYRLTQTDINGATDTLKTVVAFKEEDENFAIHYAASPEFVVISSKKDLQVSDLAIISATGQIITDKVELEIVSANQIRIHINTLSDGVYWVRSNEQAASFVKMN